MLLIVVPGGAAAPGVAAPPAPAGASGPRALVGRVLYVAARTTVRTRGAGNRSVDLPRGRAVVVSDVQGQTLVLVPCASDVDLLRAFGVSKVPRYTAALSQVGVEFLDAAAWALLRDECLKRLRERWPALRDDEITRIFGGEPFPGMSLEQAEEAVGAVALSRERQDGPDGAIEIWRIGRRPRSAELRLFTEGRERVAAAGTFEEYLAGRTRAILRFQAGVLVAIDPQPTLP